MATAAHGVGRPSRRDAGSMALHKAPPSPLSAQVSQLGAVAKLRPNASREASLARVRAYLSHHQKGQLLETQAELRDTKTQLNEAKLDAAVAKLLLAQVSDQRTALLLERDAREDARKAQLLEAQAELRDMKVQLEDAKRSNRILRRARGGDTGRMCVR